MMFPKVVRADYELNFTFFKCSSLKMSRDRFGVSAGLLQLTKNKIKTIKKD